MVSDSSYLWFCCMIKYANAFICSWTVTKNHLKFDMNIFPRTESARSYERYWQFRKLPQRIQRFIVKMCRLPNTEFIV